MSFCEIIEKTDYAVLMLIRDNLQSAIGGRFFVCVSQAGNSAMIWMISAFIFLFFKKTRPAALMVAVVYIFELIIVEVILKDIVERPRPFAAYGFDLLIQPPPSFSFPSGHAASSFSSAVIFYHFIGRKAYPFIAAAFLISFSRIYLMVHYPSDVIAGALLGILTAFCAVRIYERLVVPSGKKSKTD
ncbi:MAG: phosphatase PAP2 family protein [Spirochaetes bacterium]|nr:phosphatase PAP2 family protein [Spirochaetota bacterium]